MEKIQILLSTYNGEKFLIEQLDSILDQDYPNLSLLIRDDGSSDSTIELIERYIKEHQDIEIKLIKGENLGVLKSFIDLVENSDNDVDFFAFSDQDDVWFKDKISRGIKALNDNDTYLMYACNYIPVDKKLGSIKYKDYERKPSFYNAIVENIATGCSIVFNKKLRDYVKGRNVDEASIHDWWFYLVATGLGDIFYDNEPSFFYRQHEENSIGAKDSLIKKWKSRLKRFFSWRSEVFSQPKLLLSFYEDKMDREKVADLKEFLAYRDKKFISRIKYIKNMKIFRQNKFDDFLLKILMFFKLIK